MDQFCVPFYIFLRCVELYEIEEANQKRAPNSKTILGGCRLVIPRGLFPDNCHFIWNQQFFVFFKRLEYSSWRIKLEIFLNLETFFRLSFCEFLANWEFPASKIYLTAPVIRLNGSTGLSYYKKWVPYSKTILGVCWLIIPRGLFTNNCHFKWLLGFFVFSKRLEEVISITNLK